MTIDWREPPKATKGDVAHATVKAGLSSIPVVGGSAVELFQCLVMPPLERRRIKWMSSVGDKLQEIEDRGIDLEELGQEDEFITAVMHATQIALRNHQDEKREALRNAVFNVGIGESPGEILVHMFFEWIDSFTTLHLKILKLFHSPTPPPSISMGGLSTVLEYNMPFLKNQKDIYNQVWRDLYSHGLVDTEGMNTTMSRQGLEDKRTTDIGDEFLRFVSEPES